MQHPCMLLVVGLLLSLQGVYCSHFRGGIIMARPRPGGAPTEMEIFFHISWRRSSFEGGSCTTSTIQSGQLIGSGTLQCNTIFCDANVGGLQYKCTDFSTTEDWTFGENTLYHNFSSILGQVNVDVQIFFRSCCWVSPFNNGWYLPTTFSLVPRNDTGVINSTPRATTSPVIRLQHGCNHTIKIPVSDPDGDIVRCRWATGYLECGDICSGFDGAELDTDNCIITYEANQGFGYQAVALTIEDFSVTSTSVPLSKVGLQFLVYIYYSFEPCTAAPVFRLPTIRSDVCVGVPSNDTFTMQIIADSQSADVSISEIVTVSPSGTIKGELQQINGTNLYYVDISWTPSDVQHDQTHVLCYTAVNSFGTSSEQNCIKIYPGILPPEVIDVSPAGNGSLVHPSETVWSVEFDKSIQRPTVTSYIGFYDLNNDEVIHKIDASISLEVDFDMQSNTLLMITPNFTFPERALFYVFFERGVVNGHEGCKPGNEPITDKDFWIFETLDVTPPEIHFTQQPASLTNANISLKWTSNENVTWYCVFTDPLQLNTTVDCVDGSWSGVDLSEGQNTLLIQANDEYDNTAEISHTFVVDSTPPVVSFIQVPKKINNDQSIFITFQCNEACSSFDCLFTNDNVSEHLSCFKSVNIFNLEHNTTNRISVRGTDTVGNEGNWTDYEWKSDFVPPVIHSIIDTNISCEASTTPANTGQAQVSDATQTVLSYTDHKTPCDIKRTWSATDEAGNSATLTQNITLDFGPTVSLASEYLQLCDSSNVNDVLQIPDNTATAPNPCKRLIDLTYVDSTSEFTCPGNFTRTWTVTDDCTQVNVSASQTIRFIDVCPPEACGRNETIPHGACIFGDCLCFNPWYGENCDILIYKPVIENILDITLNEAQTYSQTVNVSQGTPPLTWSLVSAPSYMSIDKKTGEINWLFAIAGNHSVLIEVENSVGTAEIEWNVQVLQGYTAILDPVSPNVYPGAGLIFFSGNVEYVEGNLVKYTLASVVPVHVDVWHNNFKRTVKAFTKTDGTFSAVFAPASTEYGTFTALAKHPQSTSIEKETEWFVLGMEATPSTVILQGATIEEFNKTFYNVTTITNTGPLSLYGLTYTHNIPITPDLKVEAYFNGAVDILEPGEAVKLDIVIESSGPIQASFTMTIQSLNGTIIYIPVILRINELVPVLVVSPGSLTNARVVRGLSKVFSFNVTNVGEVAATSVQALLPSTDLMSLVSFGSDEQDEGEFVLLSEQSAVLSILVKTSPDQELGTLSGSIIVSADQTSVVISFSIAISSNVNMNLTIAVEDEYTYFAAGEPLVNGAIVRLINYPRKIDTTLVADNGTVTFYDIPEDQYELYVDGPNHQTLKQVIAPEISTPFISVFILRTAVIFSWSVTPVTFADTYTISLEADFETHVPIPVVTVTPTEIDLEELELGLVNTFQLNITNHGLIRVEDVQIQLPEHPFLQFTASATDLGDLEALSSVIVGVHVVRRTAKRALAHVVAYTFYTLDIFFNYVCGELMIEKLIQVLLKKAEQSYVEVTLFTRTIYINALRLGGPGDGRLPESEVTPTSTTPAFCDGCLRAVVGCLPSFIFPSKLFRGAGCIPLAVSGTYTGVDVVPSVLTCVLGAIFGDSSPAVSAFNNGLSKGNCLLNVFLKCLGGFGGFGGGGGGGGGDGEGKRSLKSTVPLVIEGLYTADLSISLIEEILGTDDISTVNLPIDSDHWVNYVLFPALDDESDLGLLISQAEFVSIQNATLLPNGSSYDDIVYLVQRINNTLHSWNHGVLEPTDNLTNIISTSRFNDLSDEIVFYNDKAIMNGYDSFTDAYEAAAEEVNSIEDIESESGICAVVRLRIEQELAITREAFLARLDIENNENSPLTQVGVEIYISVASDGTNATSLFSIGNGTIVSGSLMSTDDGTGWTLPSTESGAAEWLIIPYSEAAPTSDVFYDIGGTLQYMLEGEEVSIPLLPTKITVTPDPSLQVHYFWEKYVVGDDPFTTGVREPSVPFALGVGVRNAGFGTASNLKITSAQPEIIENEKGLLVDFKIIGNTIGSQSFVPSLVVDLGDLEPNSTMVVRWWMVSSLQGQFMNYSATFENTNPLGDPKLSILDELQIHELIKSVHLHTPPNEDDGILDFLVNKKKDIHSLPEIVYSSTDLTTYTVNHGEVLIVDLVYSTDGSVSLSVTTFTNSTGWTYFIYEDKQAAALGNTHVAGFNTTKTVNNVTVYIPVENSWRTTSQPGQSNKIYYHIFDYVEEVGEVAVYVLNACTGDSCPDNEREFEPAQPTPTPTSSSYDIIGTESTSDYPKETNTEDDSSGGDDYESIFYSPSVSFVSESTKTPIVVPTMTLPTQSPSNTPDYCTGNTKCSNGGTCVSSDDGYTCICVDGFTDEICSTNIDDCASDPCINNGTCIDGISDYTCICVDGFTGDHCETDINECESKPCLNGATCNDQVNDYTCVCAPGFTGNDCSTEINYCSNTSCMNGGTCESLADGFICICPYEYTGDNCETYIDACDSSPCMNGSTCTSSGGPDEYTCICVDGYTGTNCDTDINECLNNPCQNGGSCMNNVPLYSCVCDTDFTGSNCESTVPLSMTCMSKCKESIDFEQNLCIFYCQLKGWREIAVESGLQLPLVEEYTDEYVTNAMKWAHAVAEQEKFYDLWLIEMQRQNLPTTPAMHSSPEDQQEDSNLQWFEQLSDHQLYLQSWRESYDTFVEPNAVFRNLSTNVNINEDTSQDKLSQVYEDYNDVWADDLNTYTDVISEN